MGYETISYHITQTDNAAPVSIVARGLLTEIRPMLTYAELLSLVGAAVRRQIAIADGEPDPQTLLNRRYHLRLMFRAAGKEETDAIDDDFGGSFEDLRDRAVALVPSQRTQGDVRRGLVWWRKRYHELLSARAHGAGRQPLGTLASILSEGMEARDITHLRAAAIVGVPPSTLSSWLQGVVPTISSATGLQRLESALKLRSGTLAGLVRRPTPKPQSAPISGYRMRLVELRKDRYRLQLCDAGSQLPAEWQALLRYKTTKAPLLKRSKRATWKLATMSEGRKHIGWHNALGKQYCASADAEWKHASSFLGWLRTKAPGLEHSLHDEREPTLAFFALPEFVEPYFAWLVERAGGVVNNRIKTLSNFLQSLTAPGTGWLLQQPELAEKLPASVRPGNWIAACAAVNEIATAYRSEAKAQSRDPFEPIRGLLALPEPFAPIRDAIRQLDARALSSGLQSPSAAVAKRDALIVTVLLSVPLRLRNLVLLRYKPDGTGSFRKEADGLWWIRIPAHETKNKRQIDAPLPKSAVQRIDEYFAIYRPRLLGENHCEYVFVASMGHTGPFWTINARLFFLTKTYIPGCMGFHTHTWRHFVATRWLDKHPEDYLTVAHLLRDDLQTVIKTYSRPTPARAVDRANKDIDALMAQP